MSESNIPRLRYLRELQGVTRDKLAVVLEVNPRTILRWEAGEQDPNLTDLRKIAAHFRVSVAYLIEEEGGRWDSLAR
jgi:transcriptional regulator with XRE-family HTH domain